MYINNRSNMQQWMINQSCKFLIMPSDENDQFDFGERRGSHGNIPRLM